MFLTVLGPVVQSTASCSVCLCSGPVGALSGREGAGELPAAPGRRQPGEPSGKAPTSDRVSVEHLVPKGTHLKSLVLGV